MITQLSKAEYVSLCNYSCLVNLERQRESFNLSFCSYLQPISAIVSQWVINLMTMM